MYPGTLVTYVDESEIRTPQINSVRTMPLYAALITSDKGEEEWTRLSGAQWFNMYCVSNNVDFTKHGQPLLQAANAIEAGAELLCKRICAEDAYLANLTVYAVITTKSVQKTDKDGNPLYIGPDGKPTTEETTEISNSVSPDGDVGEAEISWNEPLMEEQHSLTFNYMSAPECKNKNDVVDATEAAVARKTAEAEDGVKIYPLWTFLDNGRGESRKHIRIVPNYNLSRNFSNYFMYDLFVIENGKTINTIHFVIDPDVLGTNDTNLSLMYQVNTESDQIKAYQYEDKLREFKTDIIATIISDDITESDAAGMDLLFGKTKKQRPIPGFNLDTEVGVDLAIITGQNLQNGSNGSFGNRPLQSIDYERLGAMAIAGLDINTMETETMANEVYDPVIYDVDRYKIDAFLDANYPHYIKRAIEKLATFREDFVYFRDMGTDCNTFDLIESKDYDNLHNMFCSTYCTYYDIIDPYSKKQITVTITYSLARLLVNTFNNGRNLPPAGIKHGFIIPEAIKNTVGFTPVICPGLNQKEELFDARINYATYINDELVVESLYTSQDKYTQFSFVNNVLAVQEVVKRIRTRCPAIRYSFIDGDDLAKYKSQVEEIIAPYRSNFRRLELTYLQDKYYTENKIFYATLAVLFRDFVQTEHFKVVALSSSAG